MTWNSEANTKKFPSPFYKLVVRQFLLGHTAKDGEYNVIEVSCVNILNYFILPSVVMCTISERSKRNREAMKA